MTLGELLERTSRYLPDNWQISVDFYDGGGCEVTLIDQDGDRWRMLRFRPVRLRRCATWLPGAEAM